MVYNRTTAANVTSSRLVLFLFQSFVYFFRTRASAAVSWNDNFPDVWWREYYQRGAALPQIAKDYPSSEYFLFVGDVDEIPSLR